MFSRLFLRAQISTRVFPACRCHAISAVPYPTIPSNTNQSWPRSRRITTRAAARKVFKENPFSVTLAMIFIFSGAGTLLYANYIYRSYIIGEFKAYPEPVAAKLRRALFYSNIDLQPNNAVKYYRQALSIADELGMDPFSDEILGVKIQLAFLMEKIKQYEKAIFVLETVHADCIRWIEQLGGKPGNEGKRSRVLGKTVGISAKLGELYASEDIDDLEAAEEKLMYSVTAVLKERKRRQDEGVREGEGPWMSDEEQGAALETLGNHYEKRNQHYLAAPLYLQALSLIPHTNCHAVVLMNNLSISLALQNPPPTASAPPASSSALVANAAAWARKAIALAATIKPPDRTPECDEGCAVAMINLGEFARLGGDTEEARKRYEEGRGMSRKVGFEEGVGRAEEGLRGLEVRV